MINAEMFLRDYWHAKRSIGRLKLALSEARSAYEMGARDMRTSGGLVRISGRPNSGASPVERAAIVMVDELGAEVKAIEKRLLDERRMMARIEAVVAQAALGKLELEYIRARYFDNLSVEASAQRLFCSTVTSWRLKKSSLEKIGAVLSNTRMTTAREA